MQITLHKVAIRIAKLQGAFLSWGIAEVPSPSSDWEQLRHEPRLPVGLTEGAEGNRCLHNTHRTPGAEFMKQEEWFGIWRWKCREEYVRQRFILLTLGSGMVALDCRRAARPKASCHLAWVAFPHGEICWAEDVLCQVDQGSQSIFSEILVKIFISAISCAPSEWTRKVLGTCICREHLRQVFWLERNRPKAQKSDIILNTKFS